MAAYFAVPPPWEGNPHHGRHHLRPSEGAHAPRHHGLPRPMALCGHPAHGAYGGLQPGRNEQTTLAMAPARSPASPCGHAKTQHQGHPWVPGLPRASPRATCGRSPKTHRSPQGRRRSVTPQNANRGHHPEWLPPLARTEAPSDRSPRGGAQAVLIPHGCKTAGPSSARRQGTLAAPGATAARRLPQNGESSSTRIRTEAMEVPTTSRPNGHDLPPIPDAGPRGSAPNGRTSPPFPRQSSEGNRQRFTRATTGQQTEHPATSQGRRPAGYQGDSTPLTHGQGNPRPANGVHKVGRTTFPTPPPSSGTR